VREVTRAAHESTDPSSRVALSQQASLLAASEARLGHVDVKAP